MSNAPIESEPENELDGGGVRLGKVQLAIMRVLWRRGEAAVTDVHEELEALAPTTVATMLAKLEHKGVVSHRVEGRRFIYRPLVNEEQVRRSMVGELTSQLFHGDVAALVNHLLSEHSIEAGELAELRSLIAARESGRVAGDPASRDTNTRRAVHAAGTPARREEEI
ncbi:MAG TPA: BlaI/MecI/CopY family transcriptional regulator [Thermoanaerobaculia bacterium]|nr:BlaI/MecI/CopY family transcriptional regulator [Thermoanaerobaculia bacterium]